MKNLKLSIAAFALTIFANVAVAQHEPALTAEQKAAKQTEKMSEKLLLSPEQKAKVAEINLAIVQKNEAVRNDANLSPETKKESIKGNNEARAQMIKALLNPEQLKKFEEMEANREEKAATRPGIEQMRAIPINIQPTQK